MSIHPNINGVYKEMSDGWTNINGVWRQIDQIYNNINGTWREGYSAGILSLAGNLTVANVPIPADAWKYYEASRTGLFFNPDRQEVYVIMGTGIRGMNSGNMVFVGGSLPSGMSLNADYTNEWERVGDYNGSDMTVATISGVTQPIDVTVTFGTTGENSIGRYTIMTVSATISANNIYTPLIIGSVTQSGVYTTYFPDRIMGQDSTGTQVCWIGLSNSVSYTGSSFYRSFSGRNHQLASGITLESSHNDYYDIRYKFLNRCANTFILKGINKNPVNINVDFWARSSTYYWSYGNITCSYA